MIETLYSDILNEILSASPLEARIDDLSTKVEKLTSSSLHQLLKQRKVSEKIYQRLRTTGSQPVRLYGLANVSKNGTPFQLVLSIPCIRYKNLNEILSSVFQRFSGTNIETNSKMPVPLQRLPNWKKMS